ncbi:MAG: amidase, partial [Planctomycetes bacterium]|nr:amidase [Planctomycetota bacterium]
MPTLLPLLLACALAPMQDAEPAAPAFPEVHDLDVAARVLGLAFEERELAQMRKAVTERLDELERLRAFPVAWDTPMALGFAPLLPGMEARVGVLDAGPLVLPEATRPVDLEQLAFADVSTLAALVKSRQVSCVELTELFLGRLERLDAKLNSVVTLLPERALATARARDAELERGVWRGPLHGIPYGAKDLLSAKGAPTTWGAKPYEHQGLDADASAIAKLEDAGAVLVAKLSLGALAMGDEWFRGRTNNPWNPERGSSGSSAGPAAATAAGLVPFAIGSETLGSIVSPSMRCGNTSLRPTFGRVARGGAMPLSWSMDKLGPMGRSATDLALVFDALHGADGVDLDAVTRPFALTAPVDVAGWRVGFVADLRESNASYAATLTELERLGVELVPVEVPRYPVWDMMIVLMAEAAASFDELTRDGRDDLLVQQGDEAWPNL